MGVNDKTSLLVVTKHESGSLFDLLEPFKDNNINMLQLARHPIPGIKWEYLFFIDIEGHQNNDNVKDAISKIKSKVSKLEILGSYPIAVL
jgi:chorismate mutase/prephenate dehydratase